MFYQSKGAKIGARHCRPEQRIGQEKRKKRRRSMTIEDCLHASGVGVGQPPPLRTEATPEMAAFCFDTLVAELERRSLPRAPSSIPAREKFPLFVTWKKGPDQCLRGCIGTFSEMALPSGLSEYALTAALRDSRFDPISLSELPSLFCGVSLLIDFEPARDYLDWEVGKHGIRIHFTDHSGRHRDAVFLPEVAREQGWDHVATLNALIRKAGVKERVNEELRRACRVTRFQSSKVVLSYQDYIRDFQQ